MLVAERAKELKGKMQGARKAWKAQRATGADQGRGCVIIPVDAMTGPLNTCFAEVSLAALYSCCPPLWPYRRPLHRSLTARGLQQSDSCQCCNPHSPLITSGAADAPAWPLPVYRKQMWLLLWHTFVSHHTLAVWCTGAMFRTPLSCRNLPCSPAPQMVAALSCL